MVHFLVLAAAVLTSGAAALLSGLLYRVRGRAKSLPGCGGEDSGCGSVLQTRWAFWGPLPVAIAGAFIHGAVFACLLILLVWPADHLSWRWFAWRFLIASIPVLSAAGVWFIALQIFVLRRFCLYCTVIHVLGFFTACFIAFLANGTANALPPAGVTPWIAGIAGVIGLIGVQILWRPRMFEITRVQASAPAAAPYPEDSTPLHLPVQAKQNASGVSQQSARSRMVTLIGGKVTVAAGDWPIFGSPQAENLFAYFFDYTCENCRQLHSRLAQIIAQDNSLAILLIPIPGEPACNPHISHRDAKHANACALARLGLIVWLNAPSRFAAYDEFILAEENPPTVPVAAAFAQSLVSEKIYDPSIADPVVDPLLQSGIALFHSLNLSKTPALVLRTGILRGSVASVKELREILEQDRNAFENLNRKSQQHASEL